MLKKVETVNAIQNIREKETLKMILVLGKITCQSHKSQLTPVLCLKDKIWAHSLCVCLSWDVTWITNGICLSIYSGCLNRFHLLSPDSHSVTSYRILAAQRGLFGTIPPMRFNLTFIGSQFITQTIAVGFGVNSHANHAVLIPFIPDNPVWKTHHQCLCDMPEDFSKERATIIRASIDKMFKHLWRN